MPDDSRCDALAVMCAHRVGAAPPSRQLRVLALAPHTGVKGGGCLTVYALFRNRVPITFIDYTSTLRVMLFAQLKRGQNRVERDRRGTAAGEHETRPG